jgi:REP element-mobilizing transposase RayT
MAQQPLVFAYHLIWTAYGWWLPNDPRGSGSREIRNDLIAELGELHYGRKRVQPAGRIVRQFYEQAATVLQHPLLSFDAAARAEIAWAFGQAIEEQRYTCYACAIMPDHVHLLIRKHKHQAEEMIEALKETSRLRLSATGHRATDHPVWSGGDGWKVFLDHPDEVRRTIRYIERNPLGAGLPQQQWPFVRVYDGWPLHPGHSPNSPYARRLREAGRYPP